MELHRRTGPRTKVSASALALLAALVCLTILVPRAAAAWGPRASASVVGAASVQPGGWPWAARIVVDAGGGRGYLCTGSLIAANAVLTAAHCVMRDGSTAPPSAVSASVGLVEAAGSSRDHAISEVVVHPRYDAASMRNDVAVLILDGTDDAPTLAVEDARPAVGVRAAVAGWGLTNGGAASSTLRAAATTIQPDEACSRTFAGYDAATMVCAADTPAQAAGTCNGDSGGPLVAQRADGTWAQVGVTSWGSRSCDPRLPGVYVRASAVAGWIAEALAARPSRTGEPAVDDAGSSASGAARAGPGQPVASSVDRAAANRYEGRTGQRRRIAIEVAADGRTVTKIRFRFAGSCQSETIVSAGAGTGPLAAHRGIARLNVAGGFAFSGRTAGGLRFRITAAGVSGGRITGTVRVDGRGARGCGGGATTFLAR